MKIFLDSRTGQNRRLHAVPGSNDLRRQPDRRTSRPTNHVYVSREKVGAVLDILKWEQNMTWEFIKHQEDRKFSMIKSSFGVFSIVITGMIAIYSLSQETPNGLSLTYPFNVLFTGVLAGLGLTNLVLIKLIMSCRAGILLAFRQLNCFRQAMDRISYTLLENTFPDQIAKLKETSSTYWTAFGQHRKLPLDNKDLRDYNKHKFRSADEFAVLMIALFTGGLFLVPIIRFFWAGEQSTILGAGLALLALAFVGSVIFIVHSSRKAVELALEADSTGACPPL